MSKEYLLNNREHLYQAVANRCALLLNNQIEQQGKASFIVPGGTTPAPVFEKLSQMPLHWSKISVAPSDERWIAVEHEQSNQFLLTQKLLINNASVAQLVSLKNAAKTPTEGESQTEISIGQLEQPFAVTMLGVGNDGHFASLFPGSPQIEAALDLKQQKSCIGINAEGCPVAGAFTQRMSLTLAKLIDSQVVILLITGQPKLDVIRQAAVHKDNWTLPVSALLAQTKTPVEIYWAE